MKLTGGLIIFLLLAISIIFSRCGRDGDAIDTVATPISAVVAKIRIADDYYNRKVQLKTKVFYRANENHRAWLKKSKPDKLYEAFVEEVKESARYGFNPEDYQIQELEQMVEKLYKNRKRTRDDLSNADIRITASFFLFTTHMLEGRVRYPGAREFLWVRGMPLENDIALLLKMETASDLRKEVQSLQPQDPQYKHLQKALAEYRELEKADTFDAVPANLRLKPGDEHPLIPLIKKRLSLTDYRGKISETELSYDDAVVEAVKSFQQRHGLNADGILEKETIHFLNMPIKHKADLIAINLERLRWRPHLKREKDEIVVNVPEYMLRAYKNGNEKLAMRVVLGAEYTPTPVFQDTLKYIVFSPTWNVPKSIIQEEFLPKLISNPEHFNPDRFKFYKDGQEIDPLEEEWDDEDIDTNAYSVVENPGDANSLGRVKFIMPNDFSIYLHDTPADQLFSAEDRALSHGCIRLEHPEEFAHYLLDGEKGWTEKEIQEAMSSDKPRQVNLEKTYPVYIVYRTTWVDDNGKVHFREDIYGHDKRHLARLPSNEHS
jgi:murein L,D-transpeptidase YcbB/YkuD